MEAWESKVRQDIEKSMGAVGGPPQLYGPSGGFRECVKAAEQMAQSYEHVLPKIDLNHNGKVDAEEIISLSRHSSKLDPEAKKVVAFLDQSLLDLAGMRLPGKDRYSMSVTNADMKSMVQLISDRDGLTREAMERGIAGIKVLLDEQQAKPGARLGEKVTAWVNQEAIKFAAPDAIKNNLESDSRDLSDKISHVRKILEKGDVTTSVSSNFDVEIWSDGTRHLLKRGHGQGIFTVRML